MDPLPTSRLTDLLQQRVAARTDLHIDLLARLNDLRSRVAAESRYIVALFPEYTPHDEQYHTASLFKIADILIGEEQLGRLNATELLILACATYAHDWGMAVSEAEKDVITEVRPQVDTEAGVFHLLPKENEQFARFVQDRRLDIQTENGQSIDLGSWREYVRLTHAFRSGERVRHFLAPHDSGLAESVARVCESHWLNIEDLDDDESYPVNYSVLRESVNLRALAIYLRLIDLFDLAEDRTPYVIWKYVAPRDPRSKLEWAKHRAIHSVTAQQYQGGRVVQIDGQTADIEVYAALNDLRSWCDRELRNCIYLLARTNDSRHALDILHADWRITAKGFKPIAIRFDFARDRMFEILGDEIYGGDSYVFLRELLQNSIDAIRMRREVLQRNGIPAHALGTITVTVTHDSVGSTVINWTDDGIGMDEYIIRNYLAIAGRSYYQSDDFRKIALQLDPIARFGIGLLSCFAVAEHIRVDTRREPYLGPSESLSVDIPAFDRYFRIEASTDGRKPVGTTVTVYVDRRKLPRYSTGHVRDLSVAEYLRRVAGFVEFPIVVNEAGECTVIISPESKAEPAIAKTNTNCKVVSLPLEYPLSSVLVEGGSNGNVALEAETFDLKRDLGMTEFSGALTFLRVVDSVGDLARAGYERGVTPFRPVDGEGNDLAGYEVLRFHDDVTEYYGPSFMDAMAELKLPEDEIPYGWNELSQTLSRSSWSSPFYRVYRDGVLLSSASPPLSLQVWNSNHLPVPYVTVNIPKSLSPRVDLARSRILGAGESWDAPVVRAFHTYLQEKRLPDLLALPPDRRFRELARWSVTYRLSEDTLWEMVPHEKWPVSIMEKGRKISFRDWGEIKDDTITLIDQRIDLTTKRLVSALHGLAIEFPEFPDEYYPATLKDLTKSTYQIPVLAGAAFALSFKPFKDHHVLTDLKIVHWDVSRLEKSYFFDEKVTPILQRVLRPKDNSREPRSVIDVLKKSLSSPGDLYPEEHSFLSKEIKQWPAVANFSKEIDQMFTIGECVNVKHPLAQVLLKLISHIEIEKRENPNRADKYASITFLMSNLWRNNWRVDIEKVNRTLLEVRSSAVSHGLPVDDWSASYVLPKEELNLPGYVYKI